jgi:hypothetical protein
LCGWWVRGRLAAGGEVVLAECLGLVDVADGGLQGVVVGAAQALAI